MIPNIQINKLNGGIVRGLASDDSISGFIAFAPVPSGFEALPSGGGYKVVFSAQEAFNAGVVGDFSDETSATASITITGTASTGSVDIIVGSPLNFTFQGINVGGTSSTTTTIAAQVATGINNQLGTSGNPGITATSSGAVVTLSAPRSTFARPYGTHVNSCVLTVASTVGGPTFTKTNFAGAVNSLYAPVKYHIDEYFRVGGTKLYICLKTSPSADFIEVTELQNAAGGEIRQLAIYDKNVYNSTNLAVLQSRANDLSEDKKYVQILYGANIKNVELTDLPTLASFSAENVSVVIGQDGGNVGKKLYDLLGFSVTNIGSVLGAVAAFKVNESIAWVGKLQSLPYSTNELDVAAFANGDLVRNKSKAELNSIGDKRYIFLRKFDGLAGSFISDSLTATSPISDFFSIERNRTIDKARRLCGIALLPYLSSPILVNGDGLLETLTIKVFENLINAQIVTMQNAQEISAFTVNIDPNQNVNVTDKLVISLRLVPVGVARFIEVNVSFSLTA